jgi:hypothetical protein
MSERECRYRRSDAWDGFEFCIAVLICLWLGQCTGCYDGKDKEILDRLEQIEKRLP